MTQRKFAFRSLALLLICCFVLTFAALPQQAQAIALADDVVLALLVGALAAIGVTASAPTMAQLGTGLTDLVDEWEIGQGIMSGTMFGIIANSAIALGAGAFQLGNSAWEKIQGFVDWLKGDKGLSSSSPVVIGGSSPTITIDGVTYPYIITDNIGDGYNEVNLRPGVIPISKMQVITYDFDSMDLTNKPSRFTVISNSFGLDVRCDLYYSVIDGKVYSTYFSDGEYIFEPTGSELYNSVAYIVVIGYKSGNTYAGITGVQGKNGVFNSTNREWLYGRRLTTNQITYNDGTEGIDVIQDYPDEAEPLPYVPDLPLNVRIPGSNAGTLDEVAQDITEAVNAGELEAAGSEGVDVGEVNDYGVSLSSFFPFCIPFDLYNLVHVLDAEPVAPYIEIPLDVSLGSGQATLSEIDERNAIVIDLSGWENTARILRTMELILCAIGLALLTGKVIKW